MDYNIEQNSTEIQQSIAKVQGIFDEYQKRCFLERTPEFFCLELNGEAGELANLEKKSWKGKQVEKMLFEEEAADVFIALMNYSNSKKIDLANAVKIKLKKIDEKRLFLLQNGENY